MAAAMLSAMWLRRRASTSFWPYVIGPGTLSWAALYFGGLHPALALVPIVPFMPHSAERPRPVRSAEEHQPIRSVTSSTGGRRLFKSSCCSLDSRMQAFH